MSNVFAAAAGRWCAISLSLSLSLSLYIYIYIYIYIFHVDGVSGLLPAQRAEEHAVYVPQRQELPHQQGDPQPLPVLQTTEMPGDGHVQRRYARTL